MKRSEALRLREIVELAMSGKAIDDATASEGVQLFPRLKQDGALIKAGTRINWNGVLKRASVDLWDTAENSPDNAPALWEEIAYMNGYRVLTGHISASNPVQPGEICWEDGKLYKCVYHVACTYRPSEYADAWEEVV